MPSVWMDAQSKKRDVTIHYDFTVQSIDAEKKRVKGLYGYELSYDLLFMVPPHRPAGVLYDCGLAERETGIQVDYDTLETKWENVYAIGDNADMPASKAGGVAHQEADVVADNLVAEITGEGELSTFTCTPYDCSHAARDAPPPTAPRTPRAGRLSAPPTLAPGGLRERSTGARSCSKNGGSGAISEPEPLDQLRADVA